MEESRKELLSEPQAQDILLAIERAWNTQNAQAFCEARSRIPEGYLLCIFSPREGTPCFSISDEQYGFDVPPGYTYAPEHRCFIHSTPLEEHEANSLPVVELEAPGVPCEVAPNDAGSGSPPELVAEAYTGPKDQNS